jgi:hypothetical protein
VEARRRSGRDGRRRSTGALALVALCLTATAVQAHDELWTRLPKGQAWTRLFDGDDARARVKDGLLLGTGRERSKLLQDGRLRVERSKVYTRVKHPDSGAVVTLEPPWKVRSVLELSPTMRLLKSETWLDFHPQVDEEIRDEFERFFEWDHARSVVTGGGRELTHVLWKGGEQVERERYDYEPDDVPLEIVGLTIALAVQQGIDRFDFDLLLPGGSTHGVRSRVHRVRTARRFAAGYRVPHEHLTGDGELAVVEMRLSSPVKYLLFPHEFYMVFDAKRPTRLRAMWGGDPDENLQAFRID